jgi:hypothetical protein
MGKRPQGSHHRRRAGRMRTEDIARVVHEAQRALQAIQGDPVPAPRWEDAPDYQRETAHLAVIRAIEEEPTPAEHHEQWQEHMRQMGWRYGPEKDPEALTHPCLVPYDDLPAEQKSKDVLFLAIVAALSGFSWKVFTIHLRSMMNLS